jgi:hypothetical protein
MATLIPSLGSARFDSRGELRLAERLKDFLEENAYIWHNLPMGPRGRYPDFVIVHPAKGLLVLEVKDWRMDTIASATKSDVELVTTSGSVRTTSPFEQVLVESPESARFAWQNPCDIQWRLTILYMLFDEQASRQRQWPR